VKVYIVAGEPSGDLLASGLMRALLRLEPDVKFRGVGGESMSGFARFRSLFDISEISVMGIFEVLPKLPLIFKRIRQTVSDIEEFSPDVLVTVDSWGFVSALISRLRKRKFQAPVIHYVAPQVWAWKKGRAKNVARIVDRLMTLMPGEGRWFEKWGLQTDFVGHPVVERVSQAALDPDGFRAANDIPADATVISVLPGSRHSEAKRLIPILKEAMERLARSEKFTAGRTFVVVPTVAAIEEEVRRGFEDFSLPVRVVTGELNRYNAFAISTLALAKSGTVSLELVAFGVPHLIAYTFNRLSNLAAKLLVKVRFANLINIMANKEIIPEFVLDRCRPELIAECATKLLDTPQFAEQQVVDARNIMQRFRLPHVLPSDRAAQIVSEMARLKIDWHTHATTPGRKRGVR
jgi:lipid-A-disaccharide synthase